MKQTNIYTVRGRNNFSIKKLLLINTCKMAFIKIIFNQKTIQKYIREQEADNRIRGSLNKREYTNLFNKKSLE